MKSMISLLMLTSGMSKISILSGSTCVSVIIIGNKAYCANVGDSRAILISGDPEDITSKNR
jgi:serine/threonine protein phosphatase PrpC